MHTQTLKKLLLALTFWLALYGSSLRAQTISAPPLTINSTGTNPVDFEFRADGTLIAKGNGGVGSLLTADQGAGVRMLWFPGKSAFRVGWVDGDDWDSSNIGLYSMGLGADVKPSGYISVAMGGFSTASASYTVAIGKSTTASGYASLALGYVNVSSGTRSTTLGSNNTASGFAATASGYWTQAQAYESYAIGAYNIGGGNATTWVADDPLFEIGNGTSATAKSDAVVVYKDGSMNVQGPITAAPGGDIPMYTGN